MVALSTSSLRAPAARNKPDPEGIGGDKALGDDQSGAFRHRTIARRPSPPSRGRERPDRLRCFETSQLSDLGMHPAVSVDTVYTGGYRYWRVGRLTDPYRLASPGVAGSNRLGAATCHRRLGDPAATLYSTSTSPIWPFLSSRPGGSRSSRARLASSVYMRLGREDLDRSSDLAPYRELRQTDSGGKIETRPSSDRASPARLLGPDRRDHPANIGDKNPFAGPDRLGLGFGRDNSGRLQDKALGLTSLCRPPPAGKLQPSARVHEQRCMAARSCCPRPPPTHSPARLWLDLAPCLTSRLFTCLLSHSTQSGGPGVPAYDLRG